MRRAALAAPIAASLVGLGIDDLGAPAGPNLPDHAVLASLDVAPVAAPATLPAPSAPTRDRGVVAFGANDPAGATFVENFLTARLAERQRTILVIGESVQGGLESPEALAALDAGFEVELIEAGAFASLGDHAVAEYAAVIVGDPGCRPLADGILDPLGASIASWRGAITGERLLSSVPLESLGPRGAEELVRMAASAEGTGLILTLACPDAGGQRLAAEVGSAFADVSLALQQSDAPNDPAGAIAIPDGAGGTQTAPGAAFSDWSDDTQVVIGLPDGSGGGQALILQSVATGPCGPAPSRGIGMLASTVTGGLTSQEAREAIALGYSVDIISTAAWSAMSTATFETYEALVLGDPHCETGDAAISVAKANRAVWGPAVTGNVVFGTLDHALHGSGPGTEQSVVASALIDFAAAADSTGMYICTSCYYYTASVTFAPEIFDPFGTFTIRGQQDADYDDINREAGTHPPEFAGLTDSVMDFWGYSGHAGFMSVDPSFSVFARAVGSGQNRPVIVYRASTCGSSPCGDAPTRGVGILSSTVTGGLGSQEAREAMSLGYTVDLITPATWSTLTTAQFDDYEALVLGDPFCATPDAPISAAKANRAVWGPAVTGNVVFGTMDHEWHGSGAGTDQSLVARSFIDFAAAGSTTGMYISTSCYYFTVSVPFAPEILDPFGSFMLTGQMDAAYDDINREPGIHPAQFAGLTDSVMDFWGYSGHAGFTSVDPSFSVFARAVGSGQNRPVAIYRAAPPCDDCGTTPTRGVGILSSTVVGGLTSLEAAEAIGLGYSVDLITPATWSTLTTAQFADYQALVLGDPDCQTVDTPLAAAVGSTAAWGPAVQGNVAFALLDHTWHDHFAPTGTDQNVLARSLIDFAAAGNSTGMYINGSCYYHFAATGPKPIFAPFGAFSTTGGGYNDINRTAGTHPPQLASVTDAVMDFWGNSAHGLFNAVDPSFTVFARAADGGNQACIVYRSEPPCDDNSPPTSDAGGPYVAECSQPTSIALDGTGSSDPDQPASTLSYLWTTDCVGGVFDDASSATPVLTLDGPPPCPVTCTVTLTVTDDGGLSDDDDGDVTVEDRTPPVVTATTAISCLWSPNHTFVDVGLTATATDACDPAPLVQVTGVTSSEPTASMLGAGGKLHCPDAIVSGLSVQLRSERSGLEDGRVYGITVRATDACGNSADTLVEVRVPHDQNPKSPGQTNGNDPDGPCVAFGTGIVDATVCN